MTLSADSEKEVATVGDTCDGLSDVGALPRSSEMEMHGCQIIAAILRFERKLEITEDGHRIWAGAQTKGGKGRYKIKKLNGKRRLKGKPKPNGNNPAYGKFWVGPNKKHTVQAHVFAAFLAGKISTLRVPAGMHLAHSCKHGSLCVDCTRLVPAEVNLWEARNTPIRAPHRPPPSKLKRCGKRSKTDRVTRKSSPAARKAVDLHG